MMPPPLHYLLISVVGGIATHAFYFNRGEHHLFPWRYVQGFLALCILTGTAITHIEGDISNITACLWTLQLATVYLFGLYSSLVVYRLFLNPLNKFPGPPLAKLTALNHSFRVGKKKDMYLKLYNFHQEMGKFVRIGPNDLSVSDADVMRLALGPQSKCTKAPWYDVEYPAYSMHSTRSRAVHDRRRRIWSPAFSDKALRGYEKRVQKYNNTLIEQLNAFSGKNIRLHSYCKFNFLMVLTSIFC